MTTVALRRAAPRRTSGSSSGSSRTPRSRRSSLPCARATTVAIAGEIERVRAEPDGFGLLVIERDGVAGRLRHAGSASTGARASRASAASRSTRRHGAPGTAAPRSSCSSTSCSTRAVSTGCSSRSTASTSAAPPALRAGRLRPRGRPAHGLLARRPLGRRRAASASSPRTGQGCEATALSAPRPRASTTAPSRTAPCVARGGADHGPVEVAGARSPDRTRAPPPPRPRERG